MTVYVDHLPDHVRVACAVVERGWPVLAIRIGTKQPLHTGSVLPNHRDHWLYTAEQVAGAWESAADPWTGQVGCQFAAVTGQPNNEGLCLVALDADVDGNWSRLDDLLADAGSEAIGWGGTTLRAQHSPDRSHLRGTVEGICPRTGELVAGIEFRGDGGYVLLIGAVHPSGSRYAMTRPSEPLPVPESLRTLARGAQRRAASEKQATRAGDFHAREPASAFDRVVTALGARVAHRRPDGSVQAHCPGSAHRQGDRDPSLSVSAEGDRVLLNCFAGCTVEQVTAAMGLTVADLFDGSGIEAVEVVTDAEYGRVEAHIEAARRAGESEGTVRELRRLFERTRARELFDAGQVDPATWAGVTGDQFDPATPEPVPCVLKFGPDQYAFAPGINFLYGFPDALKTWLFYYAMLQELERGNRTLLLDYELTFDEAMRRMYVLGASREMLSGLVYVQPDGLAGDAGREQLVRRFDHRPPSLIVIDSMGEGMGQANLDENLSRDVTVFTTDLPKALKRTWPESVIGIIDHIPKGTVGATLPIGSQRKHAQADGLYQAAAMSMMSRKTRGSGRVTARKGRKGWSDDGESLFDYEFGGGGPFVVRPPDPNVTSLDNSRGRKEASSVLDEDLLAEVREKRRVSRMEITGAGREGQLRRAALNRLLAAGLVVEEPEGRTKMVSIASPDPSE